MDEVVEWIGEQGYDPQGRIAALAEAHGHSMGPWYYAERVGQWQYEGRCCTVCGATALMGHRTGRPGCLARPCASPRLVGCMRRLTLSTRHRRLNGLATKQR
jgi:hypothetical protein